MPQQTKIFRVFVSSTFTDMKLERSILQRDAFPKLEKYCEEKGAKFQAVDLRWGVNEESSLNQKTLQICFNEVARCQKISPRPNFLILLGDKYGWQPIPEIIPEQEMNAIFNAITDEDKVHLKKWYRLDKNDVPKENPDTYQFVLQPREKKFKEYSDWAPVETKLRDILHKAVDKLNFSAEKRSKYFASATHQEIIRGALNPPEDIESPEKHVFAFKRNIEDFPKDQTAAGFIDLVNGKQDEDCKAKLEILKAELRVKLGECHIDQIQLPDGNRKDQNIEGIKLKGHYINYNGKWLDNKLVLNDLQHFNDVIYEALKKAICDQLALVFDKDEINHEVKLHDEFKSGLTRHFEGREDILKTIRSYLDNKSEKRVMSLIGASGTGKSSVMAQAVKLNEDRKTVCVFRFIGTTSGSSNIMSLLQSVCGEISRAFGIDAKTLARDGDEKEWYDINGLSDILRKCLALATEIKPILLFLDSLDQLSDTDNARALYWLPGELPDHVRLVVSSLPELGPALNATYQEPLLVLPVEEAIKILEKWFSSIHRRLTVEQKELVINCFSKNQLPIYLKLAFEKSKHWHSYDKQHTLREDVKGIIGDYFNDLEHDYPEDFVRNAICYILCGKYSGLAENEILEILAFDPEYWQKFINTTHKDHRQELRNLKEELKGSMKIPIAVWSRLYLDFEPFLTERDTDGVPIITFFHRQFNEVLRERYELQSSDIQN
jgi:hypothetical protein